MLPVERVEPVDLEELAVVVLVERVLPVERVVVLVLRVDVPVLRVDVPVLRVVLAVVLLVERVLPVERVVVAVLVGLVVVAVVLVEPVERVAVAAVGLAVRVVLPNVLRVVLRVASPATRAVAVVRVVPRISRALVMPLLRRVNERSG